MAGVQHHIGGGAGLRVRGPTCGVGIVKEQWGSLAFFMEHGGLPP